MGRSAAVRLFDALEEDWRVAEGVTAEPLSPAYLFCLWIHMQFDAGKANIGEA